MPSVKHDFTQTIIRILEEHFPGHGEQLLDNSELLQYINIKAKAANRGSKSRSGFANHYAIYVLIEDYLNHGFNESDDYTKYEGAQYSRLLNRQRELPFGSKLQNHALNHRLNEEFHKYFPTSTHVIIIRDVETSRYWINEKLLQVKLGKTVYKIAPAVKAIIDAYIEARSRSFDEFMGYCEEIMKLEKDDADKAIEFVKGLLKPNIDARIFEIVSYAILREFYSDQKIYWGWSPDEINPEFLVLYKTGRTNANDGGIDFVMKPLGRFFQVTETVDAGKYFLDIDKVQRYPITFVVKTEQSVEEIKNKIKEQAIEKYGIVAIVEKYMTSVEEVINIAELMLRFDEVLKNNKLHVTIEEIILQSKVEFNIDIEDDSLEDESEDQ